MPSAPAVHLAQVNVARLRRPVDHPATADFVAELKRMYVRPSSPGRRVGAAMVAALLDHARRLGARRVVLETGARPGAALALYRRLGFTEMPCWGDYGAGPLSVCLTRTVDPAADREPSAPPLRTEP